MKQIFDNTLILIIVCITAVSILKVVFNFLTELINRKRTFTDKIISQETYFSDDSSEPNIKVIIERTWDNGSVEIISDEY